MADFTPLAMSTKEFMRTNFFEILIEGIDPLAINNTTIPDWTHEVIEVGRGGSSIKHVGKSTVARLGNYFS